MTENNDTMVKSVGRALDIVEALQRLGAANATEVADSTDMPVSTVYNYLQTFREREYVEKRGDEYRLAARFVHIGDFVRHRSPLYRVGKSNIVWLAEETGKTANLLIEEHGRGIYLVSENRERNLRNYSHVRRREALHSTGAGKAILMSMPDEEIESVIESDGLEERTEHTITDREVLFEEIERSRERGYALSDEENTKGIRAVGAPIENPDGSYAAVSVSGLVSRSSTEEVHEELAPLARDAASAIEVELGP